MRSPAEILKSVFGYKSFRPFQEDIISNILNRKDLLAVMPTGGGKSLCYQVPALIFDGLTVVISPLISLMMDQVSQLRQLGVSAVMLNSAIPSGEYCYNYDLVMKGKARLLYLAPESLQKEDVIKLLLSVRVDCITVDEAHCISEWGHDFRKEYRQIALLRKRLPSAVFIAFTATATRRVQDDIIKSLEMQHPEKFVASFDRTNLFLKVVQKNNPYEQAVAFINEHRGKSGIIYCFSRKQVDDLYKKLSAAGYSARPYHAGLSDVERHQNQDQFIKDDIDIIIATIAFGMGINKPDVRFVLHYDLPKNIESYYQEIGRAGRDGLKADCLLLFGYGDLVKLNHFIDQKETERDYLNAKSHLNAMVSYAECNVCRRIPMIEYFGEKFNKENCGMCDNCVSGQEGLVDITVYAQKFLSAVKRTGEMFGAQYIIDVITGKENERILGNRHQSLSVFGCGMELDKSDWQFLVPQFVANKLLIRDPVFGGLKIADKGKMILLGSIKLSGRIKERKASKAPRKKTEFSEKNNQDLFNILRSKRKELAAQMNVPPYVIFSDKTLQEMCNYMPCDKISFLEINGVGKQKLESYGNIFISLIKDYSRK
ncbi:MAG: DNA helicase RecQ [Syntrophothermus sp.]